MLWLKGVKFMQKFSADYLYEQIEKKLSHCRMDNRASDAKGRRTSSADHWNRKCSVCATYEPRRRSTILILRGEYYSVPYRKKIFSI